MADFLDDLNDNEDADAKRAPGLVIGAKISAAEFEARYVGNKPEIIEQGNKVHFEILDDAGRLISCTDVKGNDVEPKK